MFGRATITLGIGRHSSFSLNFKFIINLHIIKLSYYLLYFVILLQNFYFFYSDYTWRLVVNVSVNWNVCIYLLRSATQKTWRLHHRSLTVGRYSVTVDRLKRLLLSRRSTAFHFIEHFRCALQSQSIDMFYLFALLLLLLPLQWVHSVPRCALVEFAGITLSLNIVIVVRRKYDSKYYVIYQVLKNHCVCAMYSSSNLHTHFVHTRICK